MKHISECVRNYFAFLKKFYFGNNTFTDRSSIFTEACTFYKSNRPSQAVLLYIKAMDKIQERESDLKKLRDGELRSTKKKQKMDENLQNEAFEKYLSLFYNRTSVVLPEYSDDENEMPVYKDKDIYVPDVQPNGFFGIDHRQSTLRNTNTVEDEKDCDDELDTPLSRLRSQSLPIINEEPSLEYDKNVVLEDTSVELSGERTKLSNDKNKPKKKRKSSSARQKYKHRSQKEIIVGGSYPTRNEVLHEVSRESAEIAMVENENGEQYEAIVIAPDGFIPNSVVAALFNDMRSQPEVEVQQVEEVIQYRPPQLTLAQLMEIKASGTQTMVNKYVYLLFMLKAKNTCPTLI